jgi:superfamily II DNA/RNA helicase
MLDMGFIPDIERICKLVPFTRQTLFFTATMPNEIRRVTEQFLHNPEKIEVSRPASTAVTVTQAKVATGSEGHAKREMLRALLRGATDLKNAIIFCNRKREVALLAKSLQKHGFSVGALHGDMEQSARTAALEQFRKGDLPILVASDVAARGLDIPDVSHIFNFDVPHHPDDYVHRIGRTGRAGRTGVAVSLVSPADQKSLAAIEKLIGQEIATADSTQWNLDAVPVPDPDAVAEPRSDRERRARRPRATGRYAPEKSSQPTASTEPARPQPGRAAAAPAPARERERPPAAARERTANAAPARERGATPPPAAASRQEPRRRPDNEPADHSHLPAFLLRPVRAPV